MILTCENCDTRYLLSASQLGGDGRRVRCSHCGHEWYQEPPEDEDFAAAMAAVEPIPDSVRPVPEGSSLPVAPEDIPAMAAAARATGGRGGYLAAGLVLLLAFGLFFAMRDTVVRLWPQSLALYQLTGVKPSLPGEGLVIDRISAQVVAGGRGINVLEIKGYVLNLSQRGGTALPPLRVTLQRAGGETIDSWLIAAPASRLGYEEEAGFSTSYPAPPTDARQVSVRFDPFGKAPQ